MRATPDGVLDGTRVVITRSREDSERLAAVLQGLGATVAYFPAIVVESVPDLSDLDRALGRLGDYDWAVFLSRHAVAVTLQRVRNLSIRVPSSLSIGAVGLSTKAKLETAGLRVHCTPSRTTALDLGQALVAQGIQGKRVFFPRGDRSRPDLPGILTSAGAIVDQIVVYRTGLPARVDPLLVTALEQREVDVLVVASPSAVQNMVKLLPRGVRDLQEVRTVCIGPTTVQVAREIGLRQVYEAAVPDDEGLIQAIVRACTGEET